MRSSLVINVLDLYLASDRYCTLHLFGTVFVMGVELGDQGYRLEHCGKLSLPAIGRFSVSLMVNVLWNQALYFLK